MKFCKYIIFFTLLSFGFSCRAQQQVQTFNKIYKIKETASAQMIKTVYETDSALILGSDIFYDTYFITSVIQKTDKSFDSVFWSYRFGNNTTDTGYFVSKIISINNENNIMATGLADYYNEYKQDVWLIKLDKDGKLIWEETMNSDTFPDANSRANDIDLTPDNGFVLTGNADIAGLIIKVDSAGNKLWEYTVGENNTSNYVYLESCIVLPDSGLLIGGNSDNGHDHFEGEAFILKLDKNGNFLWKKSFGGNYKDRGTQLAINNNGEIYGVYERYTKANTYGDPTETKISAFKVDSEGNTLFEKRFGKQNKVYWPKSITFLNNDDLLIAGEWLNMANSWMIRLSPSGDSIWYKEYHPPSVSPPINYFSFAGAIPVNEHEILAFGEARTNSEEEDNYCWLIKTDGYGCLANINIVSQPDTLIVAMPGDEIVLSISAKSSRTISYQWYKNDTLISGAVDSVFVINSFEDNDAGDYYCSLSNSCETINSHIVKVEKYNSVQIQQGKTDWFVLSPNPATSSIRIKLLVPGETITGITLFSIDGKELYKITENINNSNETTLDISTLPAGIYLISVMATGITGVKKFLKVD